MAKKPKFSKIAIVVFLTVLIWVWADLAQDQRLPLSGLVTITVAQTNDPTIWMAFKGADGILRRSVLLDRVELKGPARHVAEVDRMKNKGTLDVGLFLDPKQPALQGDGAHVVDVLNLLRQSDQMRQLALTVESCEPRTLTVQVQRLVEKSVPVQCIDENGGILSANIDPATVNAYVPGDEVRTAKVRLSAAEQQQAKTAPVVKTPFVELAAGPGQTREVPHTVTVKLPSQETALTNYAVQATLGFIFSANLQGKYQVDLQNKDDFANVFIQATSAARDEFVNQKFSLFLEILDTDRLVTDFQDREVHFNFPQEYVRRGEIEGHPLKKAHFRIVPVTPETGSAPELPK